MFTFHILIFLMRLINWAENLGSECQWKNKRQQKMELGRKNKMIGRDATKEE